MSMEKFEIIESGNMSRPPSYTGRHSAKKWAFLGLQYIQTEKRPYDNKKMGKYEVCVLRQRDNITQILRVRIERQEKSIY